MLSNGGVSQVISVSNARIAGACSHFAEKMSQKAIVSYGLSGG
jgi:hypothetical protein